MTQMDPTPRVCTGAEPVLAAVIEAVAQIVEQVWDLEQPPTVLPGMRLVADFEFQSLDIVMLIVALEERFGRSELPFDQLLMDEGQYVDDIEIDAIASFLYANGVRA